MTIRGGGRPRDSRVQAPRYDEEHYAYDEPWTRDPRQAGARNGRRPRGGGSGLGGILRFLVFAVVLGGVVLGVLLTVLRPLATDALVGWAYDNPSALRIPFVADLVRERLGPALTEAPSDDPSDVTFTVREGDNVASVAARLEELGFVRDSRAFIFQATVDGLTPKLQAGNFRLARSMTPEQLVLGLVENRIVIVVVPKTFRESLRIDQMATLIQTWPEEELSIDPEEFRDIATEPPDELLEDYPWLQAGGLPDGTSLEGYLFPSRYDLRPETTAEDLVRMMLDQFAKQVGADRAGDPTFYERLILASIVEREARVEEERPKIAGVYQNRLNGEGAQQILNADPTVFYALDTVRLGELPFEDWTQYAFWVPPGEPLAEVELPPELEGYNTYRNRGLPPGPICSPGITSIEAALAPDTEDGYFYFVAIPGGNGEHDFSTTFEEHQQKLREYGYL
ncbi:MAG TPA: endolytic transglycosylase MltG [Vitreimonas sp.]|nr:endolytic transglycosylase MltG [Vitreimonas sp.]